MHGYIVKMGLLIRAVSLLFCENYIDRLIDILYNINIRNEDKFKETNI